MRPDTWAKPGHFTVIVLTEFGALLPVEVKASNLAEALDLARALPLAAWFPTEDDDE